MIYKAAIYLPEPPEVTITARGIVHSTFESGGRFFEQVTPIDAFEAYIEQARRVVREWREAHEPAGPPDKSGADIG